MDKKKTIKYRVMTRESAMQIVGVPMWKGVWFDTREEAEAAIPKAREEINSTWAYPHNVPLWVEPFDVRRVPGYEAEKDAGERNGH